MLPLGLLMSTEEVEEGRVVRLVRRGEDAQARGEEVDLGGEIVGSVGRNKSFTQFTESGEDLGDFVVRGERLKFGWGGCWWG
jgi:hypothetical protein